MKRKESAAVHKGQGNGAGSRVEILHLEVMQPEEKVETIMLYGFVHSRLGQITGFTLSCTVYWQADEYSLDSGDEHARMYFSRLVENHANAELFSPEAALEMTFTDQDLNEPIGFGSGYLKLQGSSMN